MPITSQGATFFFTIEAAEVELKDSVSPEPDTIALVQQKSLRLLSVVENTIHLQILTLTAQSLAMVVRNASSALEALTWLQSGEEFDLAIIDLDLKKMSGNWLASQIQQRAAQLPLVMFTEREQEANKLNWAINWTDRLIKPIKRDQLAAIALSISQDAAKY